MERIHSVSELIGNGWCGMPRRATKVAFSLRASHEFPNETIVDVHDVGDNNRVIATITPNRSGFGIAVWSLLQLTVEDHDGGGPGNGVSITIINVNPGDDDTPRG